MKVTYEIYLTDPIISNTGGDYHPCIIERQLSNNEYRLGEAKAVAARIVTNGFYYVNANKKNIWISPNQIKQVNWVDPS